MQKKKNWWYFSIQGLQKLHVSILWKGPLNKLATSRITKVHLWPITSLSVQDQSGGENYRMAATVVVIYDITFYRVADFMRNNFKSSNNHYFALFGTSSWRWPLKTFFFLSPSPPDSPTPTVGSDVTLRQNTVCLKGPVKKYLPIAWARNQPITYDKCHFLH